MLIKIIINLIEGRLSNPVFGWIGVALCLAAIVWAIWQSHKEAPPMISNTAEGK